MEIVKRAVPEDRDLPGERVDPDIWMTTEWRRDVPGGALQIGIFLAGLLLIGALLYVLVTR